MRRGLGVHPFHAYISYNDIIVLAIWTKNILHNIKHLRNTSKNEYRIQRIEKKDIINLL